MLVKRWEVHLRNRSVGRPVYATERNYVKRLPLGHPEPGQAEALEETPALTPADLLSRGVNPRPSAEVLRTRSSKLGASLETRRNLCEDSRVHRRG